MAGTSNANGGEDDMAQLKIPLDAQRFAKGLTWKDYMAQMGDTRARTEDNYAKSALTEEERKFFSGIGQARYVLMLAENWCGRSGWGSGPRSSPRSPRRGRGRGSVARRDDPRALDHKNHAPLGGPRPMHHALRDRKPLSRCELDGPAFEINHETPLHDIEELVFLVVLVPVELALQHAEPHDAVVHAAKRLVIPGIRARIDERLNVNQLERSIFGVEIDRVRCLGPHG